MVRGNPAEDVTLLQDAANLEWIVQGGRAHKQPELSQAAEAAVRTNRCAGRLGTRWPQGGPTILIIVTTGTKPAEGS